MKTITRKVIILRVSPRSAIFVGCIFDAGDGAFVACGMPAGVGTEDCINGFGGTWGGTGENTLSCTGGVDVDCTTFCEVPAAIGFGICAGIGVTLGNCGVISSIGSAGASGIAVLGAMDVGGGGGVVVVFVMDAVASGLPHRGQNEACRNSSALQRGHRKVDAGGDAGCAGDGGGVVDVSHGA